MRKTRKRSRKKQIKTVRGGAKPNLSVSEQINNIEPGHSNFKENNKQINIPNSNIQPGRTNPPRIKPKRTIPQRQPGTFAPKKSESIAANDSSNTANNLVNATNSSFKTPNNSNISRLGETTNNLNVSQSGETTILKNLTQNEQNELEKQRIKELEKQRIKELKNRQAKQREKNKAERNKHPIDKKEADRSSKINNFVRIWLSLEDYLNKICQAYNHRIKQTNIICQDINTNKKEIDKLQSNIKNISNNITAWYSSVNISKLKIDYKFDTILTVIDKLYDKLKLAGKIFNDNKTSLVAVYSNLLYTGKIRHRLEPNSDQPSPTLEECQREASEIIDTFIKKVNEIQN